MTSGNRLRIGFVALVGVAADPISHAHHSPAAFDLRSELRLEGDVVAVSWRNPHTRDSTNPPPASPPLYRNVMSRSV